MAFLVNPYQVQAAVSDSFSNTYSVDFDGVSEYVDLGDVFDYGTFSISAWVKADVVSASKYEGIVSKRAGSNPSKQFNLSLDTANKIYFWIFQSNGSYADIVSNSAISAGSWYHILAVADGSVIKMYVNGTLQTDTQSYDGTFQNSGSTTKIGEAYTHFWNGNIDEVAYWNSDQSSNVASIYNSGTPADIEEFSPLSWYRMGDGDTHPTLTDSGSGSNDGTMTNMDSGNIEEDIPS